MFAGGLPLFLLSVPLSYTTGRRTDHFTISGPWENDLGQFGGRHHLEEIDVIWETFCHMVSNQEVFLASPHPLNLMDIRAQEASRGGHLLEGVGEVKGPLVVIVRVTCFEIWPPSHLDEFGVFSEDFLVALLEEPCQGSPIFPPSAGLLFRSDI